jgi:prepilin-type N-terminal cleavage/methylation domain-containing protein
MLTKEFEKGFTLIEAMITMLIVSIGLLAMASLLITAIKVNQDNEMRLDASTKADAVANYAIAKIRTTVGLNASTLQTAVNAMVKAPSNNVFTPTIALNPNPTQDCKYHTVDITISWTLRGNPKSVVVHTGAMTNTGGC